MLNKTRARAKKFLYELKENSKAIDSGTIIETSDNTILKIIENSFNKMEYFHAMETKYFISSCIECDSEKKNLSQEKAYAEFSLYVTLIGYLDNKIAMLKRLYDRLVEENNGDFAILIGKIVSATDLRNHIFGDYLSKFGFSEEDDVKKAIESGTIRTIEELQELMDPQELSAVDNMILKTLLSENPTCENFGDLLANTSSNAEDIYLIAGFIQAYLDGFKQNDNVEIEDISSFYEKRKKLYIKYREKCDNDIEKVKGLLKK
ncbi:MAG: hypothetical protein K2I70_06015 [Bacilli bacterium]|nr:hypothetical protein [Bacilli bacterium]